MRSIVGALLNRAPVDYKRDRLFQPLPSPAASDMGLGAMEAQSTIFAIVDRIATAVAAVEWQLLRKAPNRDDREPVDRHPALSVFNEPNEHYTRTELIETVQQHFELAGESILLAVRPERMPKAPPMELWPVRPDKMVPVPHRSNFIDGWLYVSGQERLALDARDVLRVKRPNPLDPFRGLGPIGSLIADMDGERAAAEWNAAFFRNGAEPGGIIEVPDLLSDAEFEKIQEHWNSQHRGVRNAHRVAVIEAGSWKDRRFTMRDMQFEQLRRFSKEAFRTAWAFPKPMLGDVEDVNRANADAGNAIFMTGLVVPRLNRLRTLLNHRLLPQFNRLGKGVEFDYVDPTPPNAQQIGQNRRLDALNVAGFVRAGYDPVATLAAFGFPPIEWVGPPEDRFALEHPELDNPGFSEGDG